MQLIILDRDGVINEDSDDFIKSPSEWSPIRGSLEAIARLHRAGWRVVVATNQSGIARKLFDLDTLARIHETMHRRVIESGGLIDAVFFCPHGPDDGCCCRKPLPGMFHDIAERLQSEDALLPGAITVDDDVDLRTRQLCLHEEQRRTARPAVTVAAQLVLERRVALIARSSDSFPLLFSPSKTSSP